jgi:hypothetical protein
MNIPTKFVSPLHQLFKSQVLQQGIHDVNLGPTRSPLNAIFGGEDFKTLAILSLL